MADTDTSINLDLDENGNSTAIGGAPVKKGRRKLILIVLASLLVVASAAGGSYVFLVGGAEVVEAEDAPPVIEAPRKIAYIDLEPIFIQVVSSKGVLQNVVIALALEVEAESKNALRVEREMPRLYEAYLRTLTDRPLPGAAEGNVEVTHVKNRMNAENLRLLGPGVVYDVVLRNIWITEG